MKNNIWFFRLVLCLLVTNIPNISAQINMDCDGNVGIGTSANSSYNLNILGPARIMSGGNDNLVFSPEGYTLKIYPLTNNTTFLGKSDKAFSYIYAYNIEELSSDSTQKENIRDFENGLEIINDLRPVRYDLKREFARNEAERENKIGFIGQEMIHILPEAVSLDDSTGIYSISYTKVVPVLVSAIQEQQETIEQLRQEIEALKTLQAIKSPETLKIENNNHPKLFQNNPNPFKEITTIEYFLTEDITDAKIYIYSMSGTKIKSYDLNQKGIGNIIISASEFNQGMYIYTLSIDGKVIDTKNMILTD